jgi:hypothetical protein
LEQIDFLNYKCFNHPFDCIDFTYSPFENEKDELIFVNIYKDLFCFRIVSKDGLIDLSSLLVFSMQAKGNLRFRNKMEDKIVLQFNPTDEYQKFERIIDDYCMYS